MNAPATRHLLLHIEVIHDLWPNLAGYGAGDVTEEVVELMDGVMNEIAKCSQAMAAIQAIFEAFYAPWSINKWRTKIEMALMGI